MGENGAGKSTLMNILSGSLLPQEGEIYVEGQKVSVTDPVTMFIIEINFSSVFIIFVEIIIKT